MKTFLVIGGSSGIGLRTCELLRENGHHVIATYNTNHMEVPGIEFYQYDVKKREKLPFLPDSLDGLVYAPGSIQLKPFKRLGTDDILEDIELQVLGFTHVLQETLSLLGKSNDASVVAYSSVAVQTGFNFHSQVGITKGALEGLIRSLAAELSPKIRVNGIAPSLTDTPLADQLLNSEAKRQANADRHPMKRIGTTDDIAKATMFLLSEASSWITGQIIPVDGGISVLKK